MALTAATPPSRVAEAVARSPVFVSLPEDIGEQHITQEHSNFFIQPTQGTTRDVHLAAATVGMETAAPHPCFFCRRDELSEGLFLPRFSGWRYVLLRDDAVVGIAHVPEDASDIADEAQIFGGQGAVAVVEGLRRAEKLVERRQRDYEVRTVEIPSIYISLLWLCAGVGKYSADEAQPPGPRDLFIVLPPAAPGLSAYSPYSTARITPILKTIAQAAIFQEQQAYRVGTPEADLGAFGKEYTPPTNPLDNKTSENTEY